MLERLHFLGFLPLAGTVQTEGVRIRLANKHFILHPITIQDKFIEHTYART